MLVFSGGQADSQQITCITSIQTRIGGKQSLKCVGKNPRLARAKSKNDKNISGLLNQIEEQGKTGKIGIHTFTNTSAYTIADTKIKVISIEFAFSEENHMQFFGQLLVHAEAVQQERSANATGTIVIPFPSGESKNTETVSDKADAGNGKGQTGSQTVDESSGAIANQMKESTGGEINTEPASALSVEVSLPVSWTEDGQAVCHVTFEFNDEEITIHQPVETWHSGWHILTLYYPIEHIVANYTNNAINQLVHYPDSMVQTLKENIEIAMVDDNSGEMEKLNAIMLEKQKELVNLAHAKKDYSLLADEIDILRDKKQELLVKRAETEGLKKKVTELADFLQGAPQELAEYDELMVRKYIDQIKIYDDHFTVCFKAKVEIDIQR